MNPLFFFVFSLFIKWNREWSDLHEHPWPPWSRSWIHRGRRRRPGGREDGGGRGRGRSWKEGGSTSGQFVGSVSGTLPLFSPLHPAALCTFPSHFLALQTRSSLSPNTPLSFLPFFGRKKRKDLKKRKKPC